jgi:RNA-directed DNA polymerase
VIIERIAKETGVDASAIRAIMNSASRLYKTYNIRKRNGGLRQISQPTPTVKFLQRWIVRNYIARLPVHPSVTSYRKGMSIYRNAEMHASNNYILKMDFQDFFPSIKDVDIQNMIFENADIPGLIELDSNDVEFICKIACRTGKLSIGAPSSPSISNAVLFKFDKYIADESAKRNIQYSRYADDISFSTDAPNTLVDIWQVVNDAIGSQVSPRLKVNEEKTVFSSRKRRRLITGLVLTSDNRVSIGRKKKREIRTLCFQFCAGNLSPERSSYLRGICRTCDRSSQAL